MVRGKQKLAAPHAIDLASVYLDAVAVITANVGPV